MDMNDNNVKPIDDVLPGVRTAFHESLKSEVEAYASGLGNHHQRRNCESSRCELCPYRSFNRRRYVNAHQAYHKAPHYTVATAGRGTQKGFFPQYNVVLLIFRRRALESVVVPSTQKHDLLCESARLIRE
jgi:hypothetical protein